jgi:hypothetical protein
MSDTAIQGQSGLETFTLSFGVAIGVGRIDGRRD